MHVRAPGMRLTQDMSTTPMQGVDRCMESWVCGNHAAARCMSHACVQLRSCPVPAVGAPQARQYSAEVQREGSTVQQSVQHTWYFT